MHVFTISYNKMWSLKCLIYDVILNWVNCLTLYSLFTKDTFLKGWINKNTQSQLNYMANNWRHRWIYICNHFAFCWIMRLHLQPNVKWYISNSWCVYRRKYTVLIYSTDMLYIRLLSMCIWLMQILASCFT